MAADSQSRVIASGSYISAIAAAFFLLLPLSIGAAAENDSYTESALGALATVYLVTFTLTGIGVASWMTRVRDRHLTFFGYSVLALGFLLASYSINAYNIIAAGFGIAGIGAGILYSASFRIIGSAKNLESAFGWKLFVEQAIAAMLFFYLSSKGLSYENLMRFLAAFVAISALSTVFVPEKIQSLDPVENKKGVLSKGLLLSFIAVMLFMAAMTAPWAFLEGLSNDIKVSGDLFSKLGASGLLLGAVGGFTAAVQGNRFKNKAPLLGAAGILILIFAAVSSGQINGFIVFALLFPFVWNYALAFQLSVVAHHDTENNYAAWLAPAIALGASIGPIFGGVILDLSSEYILLLICAGTMATLALFLSVWAAQKSAT